MDVIYSIKNAREIRLNLLLKILSDDGGACL